MVQHIHKQLDLCSKVRTLFWFLDANCICARMNPNIEPHIDFASKESDLTYKIWDAVSQA